MSDSTSELQIIVCDMNYFISGDIFLIFQVRVFLKPDFKMIVYFPMFKKILQTEFLDRVNSEVNLIWHICNKISS